MGRRLFILPDSPYTDVIIQKCEEVSQGQNVYVCVSRHHVFKYIKSPNCSLVTYHPVRGFRHPSNVSNLRFEGVYINLNGILNSHFYKKVIQRGSPNARLICMFWSAEVYNHPSFDANIYDPFSKRYLRDKRKYLSSPIIDKLLKFAGLPTISGLTEVNKEFDFFCALFVEEFMLFKQLFQSDTKFVQFTLLDTSYFIKNTTAVNQTKVLLGNSGSLENNHFEALEILNSLEISEQIICPLNYGCSEYASAIVERGTQLLGDRFEPLLDFLPMQDYYLLMSQVKVAIFNHYIQQAFGNIVSLLFSGARVYLNASNPLLEGLKNLGFVLFDLNDIEFYGLNPLGIDDIIKNRTLVEQYLSANTSRLYYETLMSLSNE